MGLQLPMLVKLEHIKDERAEFSNLQVIRTQCMIIPASWWFLLPRPLVLHHVATHPSHPPWQAIIMGNLLMTGITNDTRDITLLYNDPSSSLAPTPSTHEFVSLFILDPTCRKGCECFHTCVLSSLQLLTCFGGSQMPL